jgi:Flp pilus assembly protein TadG
MNASKRRTNERGSSLIEFIIIMPALFMLLFATMEVSRLWLTIGVVAEASREAARSAALRTPFVANDATAVAKANAILTAANLTAVSGYPTVSCSPNPACPAGLGASAGTVSATVRVAFNTPIPLLVPLFGGGGGLTVTQTAQMRYEP